VVINSVRPLDAMRVFELKLKHAPRYEDVAFLREALKRVKGDDPVVLCWADGARMVIGQQFWVNYDAATASLPDMLGPRLADVVETPGPVALAV